MLQPTVLHSFTDRASIEKRGAELLTQTNDIRNTYGMAVFRESALLNELALSHAKSMYDRSSVDHYGFDQRVVEATKAGYDIIAENTANGYGVSSYIDSWMDSEAHRGNILNSELSDIGVAVYGEYAVEIYAGVIN